MSKDIAKLIAEYSKTDNDETVDLYDLIGYLNLMMTSSGQWIMLDSVLCKYIIDQAKLQYEPPIKLVYSNGAKLFNTNDDGQYNPPEYWELGNDPEFIKNKTIRINMQYIMEDECYQITVFVDYINAAVYLPVFTDKFDAISASGRRCRFDMESIRLLFDKTVLDFFQKNGVTVIVNSPTDLNSGGKNLLSEEEVYIRTITHL